MNDTIWLYTSTLNIRQFFFFSEGKNDWLFYVINYTKYIMKFEFLFVL